MSEQSDFLKALMGASKQAQQTGWPGSIDPVKTVNDTFNSVMGGVSNVGQGIGSGIQGLGKGIGDFSSMGQRNIGAVQSGLQGLGHSIFGAKGSSPRYDPLSSAIPGTPKVKRSRKAKK